MKKFISILLLVFTMTPLAWAQEEIPVPQVSTNPQVVSYDSSAAMKPVALDGFFFKVPDVCEVTKAADGHIVAKAPDGSFGITAAIYEVDSSNKLTQKTCRDLAREMRVNKEKISAFEVNKLKGHRLTGTLESRDVNAAAIGNGKNKMLVIAVLSRPYKKQRSVQVIESVEYKK